jgi:hypothetical protein
MWESDWKGLNKEAKQNYRRKGIKQDRITPERKSKDKERQKERKKEEKKGPNQCYLSQLPLLIECGLQ